MEVNRFPVQSGKFRAGWKPRPLKYLRDLGEKCKEPLLILTEIALAHICTFIITRRFVPLVRFDHVVILITLLTQYAAALRK